MIRYQALDPRPKLLFASVIALLTVVIPSLESLVALGVFVLLIILVGHGGWRRDWLATLSPFKLLIPIIFVLNAVFYASGRSLWSVPIFGFPLGVTVGGLETSAIIAIRLLILASIASWFSLTTDADEFEVALTKLGIPWSFAFVLSLTVRLIPEMRDRYLTIESAQRSRGLVIAGNPLARARARIPMFIPFFVSVINYGYELAEALAIRDFGSGPHRTSIVELEYARTDYAWYVVSVLTFAVFVIVFM